MTALLGTLLLTISAPDSSYRFQRNDTNLPRVITWVLETGVSTVVRANVGTTLGLGLRDIAVRERGFRQTGEKFTHVFAVITEPGHRGSVIVARIDEIDGSGITWYCSSSGQLILTVALNGSGTATLIRNGTYEVEFAAEKRYFLQKFAEHNKAVFESSEVNSKPSVSTGRRQF